MNKKPIILGIESSCDETAASIVTENEQGMPTILSSIVSSQVDVHKEYGGVVPELAARSHVEKIDLITKKALDESGVKMTNFSFSWQNGEFFWSQRCCTHFLTQNKELSKKIGACICIYTRVYANT